MPTMIDRRLVPSLIALTMFEAAARTGSFTLAAKELGVTQGAVSRQMRQLEEFLGTRLFVADGRNVRITDAARLYQLQIREGLQKISSATLHLITEQGAGAVRLGVLPTFANRWLIPRLGSFTRRHPNVQIGMSMQTRPFNFSTENLDAAIHCGYPDWPGVECDLMMMEEVAIVAAPQLAGAIDLREPRDLVRETLIYESTTRKNDWKDFFQPFGINHNDARRLEFETFASVSMAAMAGLGLAILPLCMIGSELDSGQLVIAYGEKFRTPRGYYFVYPADRMTYSSFRSFRAWLLDQAG